MRRLNKQQRRLVKQFIAPDILRARVNMMNVFEAILYLVRTGCQWNMLPPRFPPYTTVYHHFRVWSESNRLQIFLKKLVYLQRKRRDKSRFPKVAIIDSQSVRIGLDTSTKGVDGYKKVKGIKRQIAVDPNGYPLELEITTANVHDSRGVRQLLNKLHYHYPTISLIKADKGYCSVTSSIPIECIKSNFGTSEFLPIGGRWVVERTFSWLDKFRRLARNYEKYLTTARAIAYMAAVIFMLRYR